MLRCDDPSLLKNVTRAHASVLSNQLKLPERDKGKRLRLGFVSDDLREHPVAHLLCPILKNLDKNRFETTLFWYGKGDNSEIRKLLFKSVDHVHNLRQDYLSSRAEILNLNIDLLFDLKGWTINHYQALFSLRAAPIQITFLGFAGGTQNPCMDYLIADNVVVKKKNILVNHWYKWSMASCLLGQRSRFPHLFFIAKTSGYQKIKSLLQFVLLPIN